MPYQPPKIAEEGVAEHEWGTMGQCRYGREEHDETEGEVGDANGDENDVSGVRFLSDEVGKTYQVEGSTDDKLRESEYSVIVEVASPRCRIVVHIPNKKWGYYSLLTC